MSENYYPDRLFETLRGEKVLVTGASSGIGASIARLFASYGAYVGLHYRSGEEQARGLLEDILGNSGKAEIFQGDLLEIETRQNLVKSFIRVFGGIDVLVNNAGAVYDYVRFSELDEDSWDKTFTLNVKAPFYLSGDAFDHMKEHGGGRIINISSVSAKYGGSAKGLHYTSSKAALDSLTVGFAREGAKYNILVNSIRCGVIDTPMHTRIDGYSKENFERRISLIPLKRLGKPIDIARMTLFLASEGGDFITGQIFSVSGGD